MAANFLDLQLLDRFRRRAPQGIERSCRRRYPARLNRYLIASSYLFEEAQRCGRALSVCEIGISRGILPRFVAEAAAHFGIEHANVVRQWLGVDLDLTRLIHADYYDQLLTVDVEQQPLPDACDVYVLLHVLEHLHDPAGLLARLGDAAAEGSLVVIGVPSQPHWISGIWERTIRRQPNQNGHVSAFSRQRLLGLLGELGWEIEDERAGYVVRASGRLVEDSAWWQSANLALGQRFPGFPGEYIVCARKPRRQTAATACGAVAGLPATSRG